MIAPTAGFVAVPAAPGSLWGTMRFCSEYQLAFSDVPQADDLQVDYLNESTAPSWGALMEVRDEDTGATVFYDYTPYEGVDEGCAVIGVEVGHSYSARVASHALIGVTDVRVMHDDVSWATGVSPWTPPVLANMAYQTQSFTFQLSTSRISSVAAVSSWALRRNRNTWTGIFMFTTINMFDCQAPENRSTGNCVDGPFLACNFWDSQLNRLYMSAAGANTMFSTAHELGHAVFDFAISGGGSFGSTGGWGSTQADEDMCPSFSGDHHWDSKEYQSLAVVEGFANYYAAITLNDIAGTGCTIPIQPADWDHFERELPATERVGENAPFSCEDGYRGIPQPDVVLDFIPDYNYYDYYCRTPDTDPTHTHVNRGNETDWMRFLWDLQNKGDLVSGYKVTFPDILEVINGAQPHAWNVTDGPNPSLNPWPRLAAAAIMVGPDTNGDGVSDVSSAWNHWGALNGCDN